MVQTATAPTAAPENPTAIFDTAIALFTQSRERLLELFDKLSKPEQQANEVLKRCYTNIAHDFLYNNFEYINGEFFS